MPVMAGTVRVDSAAVGDYDDDGDTPNTQVVIHDYATAPLIFEVRGLPSRPEAGGKVAVDDSANPADAAGAAAGSMDKYRGVDIGNVIDCEGGSVIVPSYTTARAVDRRRTSSGAVSISWISSSSVSRS